MSLAPLPPSPTTPSEVFDAIFGGDPEMMARLGRHSPFIDELVGNFDRLGVKFRARPEPAPAYGSSPIRRRRRTAADMAVIRNAIAAVLREDAPMTVRQVFYRLVSAGVVGKTEAEYKQTVGRLLVEMRRDGTIPYGYIADNTRWMRKPKTYNSAEDALRQTAQFYRRAVWRDQPVYVEVWCEKDALAGVLYDVTEEYDVPLMVTRGYPSLSFLHEAAASFVGPILADRVVHLYYFGDFDPSGVDIRRAVEEGIWEMFEAYWGPEFRDDETLWHKWFSRTRNAEVAPDCPVDELGTIAGSSLDWGYFRFHVVAVTPERIAEYGLTTRPTKTTDTRSRGFGSESVELDAIPPNDLRQLVRGVIEQHLPEGALDALHVAETSERAILTRIAETMAGAA